MTGIYKITCVPTGECYIGQSVCIARRWATHKRELKNNVHYNIHLQRAYNLYGEKNFTYEILEQCPAKKLDERERFYISMFDSFNHGFNQDHGGNSMRGEENPMYGKSGVNGPRFIDYILQLDYAGTIVGRYESTLSASKAVKGSPSHIGTCLKTWRGEKLKVRRFNHKGYQWIYERDYNILKNYYNFAQIPTRNTIKTLADLDEGTLSSNT